jgi:hypothetical protein
VLWIVVDIHSLFIHDTDTFAEPAPDVGDGERVAKERKKYASYGGGSTGSIDERALPEAEELEDISDDEIGDTSSISSAVHGRWLFSLPILTETIYNSRSLFLFLHSLSDESD